MDECLITYTSTLPLRRNSLLTQPLNFALSAFIEMGIMEKWRNDEVNSGNSNVPEVDVRGSRISLIAPLELRDVFVSFVFVLIGLAMSVLVFLSEFLLGCPPKP